MNILNKKFFMFAVLLCTSTLKIVAMDGPADETVVPFAPLEKLCNEGIDINAASIREAFKNTSGLIYTQVVQHVTQQHDLSSAKQWLQSATMPAELNSFIARLQLAISHQAHPELWHLHTQDQKNYTELDLVNYARQLFQTLDEAAAQLNKKNRTLAQLLDEAISTGKTPSYLYDAKLLQEAIDLEISCWGSMKKSCTLV